MKRNKSLIGIDIFSGAGGLSLGAGMAGISVRYGVEINKYAAASFAYNHKNAEVLTGDITKIKTSELNLDNQEVFVTSFFGSTGSVFLHRTGGSSKGILIRFVPLSE